MKRPTYCPFQNISYMIRRAYREAPVILPVAAGMIVAGTAINILELVTAPAILDAVERNVPIAALLRMIAALTAAMLLACSGRAYLWENALFGQVHLRINISSPAAQQILHNVLRTSSGHCVYRAEQQSAAGHAGQYRCNGSHLGYSGRAVHQCDQFFRLSAAARFCQSGHSGDHAGRGCFQLFCRQAHPPVAISASGRRGRIPAAAFVHRQARQKQRACKGYPHFRTEGMASGAVGAKPRTVPRFLQKGGEATSAGRYGGHPCNASSQWCGLCVSSPP